MKQCAETLQLFCIGETVVTQVPISMFFKRQDSVLQRNKDNLQLYSNIILDICPEHSHGNVIFEIEKSQKDHKRPAGPHR